MRRIRCYHATRAAADFTWSLMRNIPPKSYIRHHWLAVLKSAIYVERVLYEFHFSPFPRPDLYLCKNNPPSTPIPPDSSARSTRRPFSVDETDCDATQRNAARVAFEYLRAPLARWRAVIALSLTYSHILTLIMSNLTHSNFTDATTESRRGRDSLMSLGREGGTLVWRIRIRRNERAIWIWVNELELSFYFFIWWHFSILDQKVTQLFSVIR